MFYSKAAFHLKLWYCFYLFPYYYGGNVLMGQPIDFCGVIEKPQLQNGQTAKYFDRFGNAYTFQHGSSPLPRAKLAYIPFHTYRMPIPSPLIATIYQPRYATRSLLLDNTQFNSMMCRIAGFFISNYGTTPFGNITIRNNHFNNCLISIQAASTNLRITTNTVNDTFVSNSMGNVTNRVFYGV